MSEPAIGDGRARSIVTRFAPSPTGHLHLGHAHAAIFASMKAREAGGRFLLRIEDIDTERCRPAFEDAIYEDLAWLGLVWEMPVRRQSDCMDDYTNAIGRLVDAGLVYPCFCTRREIREETRRAGHAPHGADGPLYPGTCRALDGATRQRRMDGGGYALRLDMAAATARTGPLVWMDLCAGGDGHPVPAEPAAFGDVVLARKDTPTSYHLACTLDDHLQGVTLVTRGEDLRPSTHIHRLLHALLGLDTPAYHHHGLITGGDGVRLAKRNKGVTIRALRAAGKSPEDVRAMAGFP